MGCAAGETEGDEEAERRRSECRSLRPAGERSAMAMAAVDEALLAMAMASCLRPRLRLRVSPSPSPTFASRSLRLA